MASLYPSCVMLSRKPVLNELNHFLIRDTNITQGPVTLVPGPDNCVELSTINLTSSS